MDRNMKNRRDAKDAGFIQFSGLSGSIKTGCTTFKSQYCIKHINQACIGLQSSEEIDEELGATAGPTLRLHQPKKSPGAPVAEMILAKKETRKETYYQVIKTIQINLTET